MSENTFQWKRYDWGVLAFSFFPIALFSWVIHEFGHFLAGKLLGYEMWMTLNKAGPVDGTYASETHEAWIAMAGPFVTWTQAILVLLLIQKSKQLWMYAAVFLPLVMRLTAMVISFISHPNDEARTSLILGFPIWVVPSISVGFLLVMTIWSGRLLKTGWRENLIAYLSASIVTTIIVFSDRFLFF